MTKPPAHGRDLDGIPKAEADHFMECPVCGRRFDMRDMAQVAEHIHDGDFQIEETPVKH